jgi:hypothetical protein
LAYVCQRIVDPIGLQNPLQGEFSAADRATLQFAVGVTVRARNWNSRSNSERAVVLRMPATEISSRGLALAR